MNTGVSKSLTTVPWWLVLLQGILSIFVGVMLVTAPGIAIILLVRLLGLYWLIKGVFSLTAIFHPEAKAHRGWLIFSGLLGIAAGVIVLDHPKISAIFVPAVLVTLVGIAGLLIGFNELFAAFRGAGWSMGLLGCISTLLGFFLLLNTVIGVEALPFFLGFVELAGGSIAFFFAFKLRAAAQSGTISAK